MIIIGASAFGFFPDIVDKLIFNRPFILHSFIIWISLLGLVSIIYLIIPSVPLRFIILATFAATLHPILDLSYPIPFFFPISWESWELVAKIVVRQTFPPIIEEFSFGLVPQPAIPSAGLGELFNESDAVIILVIGFTFSLLLIVGLFMSVKSHPSVQNSSILSLIKEKIGKPSQIRSSKDSPITPDDINNDNLS